MTKILHRTSLGSYLCADSTRFLSSKAGKRLKGKVQLILTSPPFPLNHKKSYGNLQGEQYLKWFTNLAPIFSEILAPNGSIVIEIGNAWMPGRPIQSLLHLEALMGFAKNPTARLRLCQEFIAYNPSRLPSPAEWVTVRRIRMTDSFTHIWWMAKTDFPKANNQNVLRPYSASMKALLKKQSYNFGKRPSEHRISENGFLKKHKGSIPHNFFEMEAIKSSRLPRLPSVFSLSNTSSNDYFLRECRRIGVSPHPARMPAGLAGFFIKLLTSPEDLVFDPFAGSNTTGFASERLGRRWMAVEINKEYARQSRIRFRDPELRKKSSRRKEE